ncbi:hypothetical protein AGMMS4957_16230 [Bacteroidia bacterium]|nr:hypothetical protein AGMMS4957_16230 [Bacteroidia bacterium]
MKKIFFNVTACICAGLLFVGCNKDDEDDVVEGGSSPFDGVIVATNIVNAPSNSQVDVLKAFVSNGRRDDEYREYEIASASYKDGGFTLTLPATIPDQYLLLPDQYLLYVDCLFDGVIISDMNAKLTVIEEGEVDAFKDGNSVGCFAHYYYSRKDDYRIEGDEDVYVMYFYVDRDVSITGTGTGTGTNGTVKFELFLKRGWNIAWIITHYYAANTRSEICTTSTGPSSRLKWHYYDVNY